MDFGNEFYFSIDGISHKRAGVPDKYQEFLPENITRDRMSYPYSYDPFLIYWNEETEGIECNNSIYTDRLSGWDYNKLRSLSQKHFGEQGDYWNNRSPEKIEAFLSEWTGKKVTLIANIQYVHLSNGFPLCRLDFYYE